MSEDRYADFLLNNPYPRQLKNYAEHLIDFSSSDYMGLSKHPLVIETAQQFLKKYGAGSPSSRLVSGNRKIYEKLEEDIAQALNKPAALIFGSGFQTNQSVIDALLDKKILGKEPRVFCDRYCHSSIQLSARLSPFFSRFQHNHLNHLQNLLEKYASCDRPKFIFIESLYSMEGDVADLAKIIILAKQYNAFLYVDDAHSVSVYGQTGWGLASRFSADIDLIMGTFSKGLGSFGGYIACSKILRDYLINRCKGLIYSTALPPPVLGAISASISLLPHMAEARHNLSEQGKRVREVFAQLRLNFGNSSTHIIPWILGDSKKTLTASQLLEKEGVLGVAIRPPSVPQNASRIRVCLSASHTGKDIDKLLESIQKVERLL